MTPDDRIVEITKQHVDLLQQLSDLNATTNTLIILLVVLLFLQLIFLISMVIVAAWSVTSVVKAHNKRAEALEKQWMDHKGEIKAALEVIVRTLGGLIEREKAAAEIRAAAESA